MNERNRIQVANSLIPLPVSFSHRGSPVSLAWGQSFHRPHPAGFADATADEMGAITRAVRSGTPWRMEIDRRFGVSKPWLRDIVLSPKRHAFFDLFPRKARGTDTPFDKLSAGRSGPTKTTERVLDIGCGWGQMTLPLAASGRHVVAIEPGEPRLQFVEAAAAQDGVADRIAFIGADFLDCDFAADFDVVLCIGVLEWIGAFNHAQTPQASQQEFLIRARKCLKAGGTLVLGIENRIGAKYLIGCPDDHLGVPHIGCLPAELASKHWKARTGHDLRCFTYAEHELRDMLRMAGFSTLEFFGAFPDYKLTDAILPLDDGARDLNARLSSGPLAREHNGSDGTPLTGDFQERLQAFYQDAAHLGIAQHYVPSFFVLAR